MEDRRFCVYEHIRKDNGMCFYVGKGTLKRARAKHRNDHHDRIVKKYGMTVHIVKDNLTEDESFALEQETIKHYVFDLGYGIDIIGYNNNPHENGHLTNCSFGGEGTTGIVHTEEWCKQHSEMMMGENNPMYGKSALDYMTDEAKEKLRKAQSEKNSGKNNPMYGKGKKVCMIDPNINEIIKIFPSVLQAANETNNCHNNIRNYCSKDKTLNGYKWRYINE